MRPVAAALALLVLAAATGSAAPTTRSCELLPHGYLAGAEVDGCSVSDVATQRIDAVVTVTGGTLDAIEIEIAGPAGQRHVFVCTYEAVASTCLFPVRTSGVSGIWTVTARIVAADPLGPFLYGNADTYARLDATFS